MPAGSEKGRPDHIDRRPTVTAKVVTQDPHMLPAARSDRMPAVGVARELCVVEGMLAAVVLDSHSPSPIREVEPCDEDARCPPQLLIQLRLGKTRSLEDQTQTRLLRRLRPRPDVGQRTDEPAAPTRCVQLDLLAQLLEGHEPAAADEVVARRDEVVVLPHRTDVPPRAGGMLERDAADSPHRRRTFAEAVPDDSGGSRLALRPVGRHVQGERVAPERERRPARARCRG